MIIISNAETRGVMRTMTFMTSEFDHASVRPAGTSTPKRLARVAYFVASHVHPVQVARMIRALRSGNPDSCVVVHHDYKVSNLDPATVTPLGNVHFIESQPVKWGGFSQCSLVMHGVDWMLKNVDFDWAVFLSGQDYPIKPLADIEAELGASTCDAYLEAVPVEQVEWSVGSERYHYRYYNLWEFPGWGRVRAWLKDRGEAALRRGGLPRVFVPRGTWKGFKLGLRLPGLTPFNEQFRCYKGTSWWTLSRRAAQHLHDYAARNPKLEAHYRRSLFAASESFFVTILMNNPSLKIIANDNKRMISWSHAITGHPDILRVSDFERIIASNAHFARKIDSRVDANLLDLLDRHIGVDS